MSDTTPRSERQPLTSKLMRGSIWIAIGALIAAALVCVVWVLIGDQDGIIGRAFLTILLLAVFAGIAIVESNLAERRPDWLALASMGTWIIALLVGAVKIWLPWVPFSDDDGVMRFVQLLAVVAILQLALLHVRLFLRASQRYVTTFTRVIVMVTFALLGILVAMLVFFLTFAFHIDFDDLYWRIVIALTILVAVGTTLIPLLNALFAPRKPQAPRPAQPLPVQQLPVQQAWPTYADGRTPLPVMPDGSPDWNAYYTGYPTYPVPVPVPVSAPAQSFPVLDAATQAPYVPAGHQADAAPAAPAQTASAPAAPAPSASDAPSAQAPDAPSAQAPDAPSAASIPDQPAPPAEPAPPFSPPVPPAPPVPPTTPPAPPVPPAPPAADGSFPPPPPASTGSAQ